MTRTASPTLTVLAVALLCLAAVYAVASGCLRSAEVPVAPSISEIDWGSHAFERHGAQADRVIQNMRVCTPQVYYCDGPSLRDTYYVYICELREGLCGGAFVGRLAVGFTAYPATCTWWYGKVKGCEKALLGE